MNPMQSPNTGPGRNLVPPDPKTPLDVPRKIARDYLDKRKVKDKLPRLGQRLVVALPASQGQTFSFSHLEKNVFRFEVLNDKGEWETP